jgi:hypothetical protein
MTVKIYPLIFYSPETSSLYTARGWRICRPQEEVQEVNPQDG